MRKATILLAAAVALGTGASTAAPSDPYYSIQWGLAKVHADAAWTKSTGAGVVVAVVDTGVDPGHPDLRGRLVPGRDLVDDDADARDHNGHGTLIAGIIAAATGNGIGVASVAPAAKIMPVRVLEANGSGSSEDVAAGIRWAVDHGADVINLSLAQEGSPGGGGILDGALLRDPSIGDAIEDAARAGATVVVAAGNDKNGGKAQTPYDATVPGSMVVGSSTKDDRRAAHSNYGPGLDLLAPGGGSATDPADNGCTAQNSVVSTWWDPEDGGSKYGGGCGTSMAVGFASGVAALLHARGLGNAAVVDRILGTADDLGPAGRDNGTGFGRLNAARALGASVTKPPPVKKRCNVSATADLEVCLPTMRPTPADDGAVKAQAEPGGGQRLPRRSPRPAPTPTTAPQPSGIAAPAEDGADTRGWPVSLASLLVAALVLAHTTRMLVAERRVL